MQHRVIKAALNNSQVLLSTRGARDCAILAQGRKLYLGNLPRDMPHQDLSHKIEEKIATYGEVDYVRVAHAEDGRKRRNKSRNSANLNEGYAFVRFQECSHAEKAYESLVQKGEWKVEWAKELHDEDIDQVKWKEIQDNKRARKEHKHRQRRRSKEKEVNKIKKVLVKLPPPAGMEANKLFKDLNEINLWNDEKKSTFDIDWEQVPADCDPGASEWYSSKAAKHVERRRERKRSQVESFALVLSQLIKCGSTEESKTDFTVVDFGSGTGGLALPLAYIFPQIKFHAVDMNPRAVQLLQKKATNAKLQNLTASAEMIENFKEPFDVALALHACGNATDFAMMQAIKNRAAFALCPCCLGKLKFSIKGGSSFSAVHRKYIDLPESEAEGSMPKLTHPRSLFMKEAMSEKDFGLVAKAGDISHGVQEDHDQNHAYEGLARVCKANIEYDRCLHATEKGYKTGLYKLLNSGNTAKAEILIGTPNDESSIWRNAAL